MRKIFLFVSLCMLTTAIFISCKKQDQLSNQNKVSGNRGGGGENMDVLLVSASGIQFGILSVVKDVDMVHVTYNVSNGYVIKDLDLFIGDSNHIPATFDQYQYQASPGFVTPYTFDIPNSALNSIVINSIAAHLVAVQLDGNGNITDTQEAWAQGSSIASGGSFFPWVFNSSYIPQPCPTKLKRNDGNGTCNGDGEVRVTYNPVPTEFPRLDSIYYMGNKIDGLSFGVPKQTKQGYVSYCFFGHNIQPAIKVTCYFTFPSTGQQCIVTEE